MNWFNLIEIELFLCTKKKKKSCFSSSHWIKSQNKNLYYLKKLTTFYGEKLSSQ